MNTLSWILYGADVAGSLGVFFGSIGAVCLFLFIPASVIAYLIVWNVGDNVEYGASQQYLRKIAKMLGVIGLVSVLISTLIPRRETIYMIAASEVGEVVVDSPEAREILTELKKTIMSNLKSLQVDRRPD